MTATSRVAHKNWSNLTAKEWESEFAESRRIIKGTVLAVINNDEELTRTYKITDGYSEYGFRVVRLDKPDGDAPVKFGFSRDRPAGAFLSSPYRGVCVTMTPSFNLRDTRLQRYGLRKDGTHNVEAISKRVRGILKDSARIHQLNAEREEECRNLVARLNEMYPDYEWDDNGTARFGEKYGATWIDISARVNFESEGFDISTKIMGITMADANKFVRIVEKQCKK